MKFSKHILVAPLFALFLASCSQVEVPEDVLTRAKQALVSVESGEIQASAILKVAEGEELNLEGNLNLSFDKVSEDAKRDFQARLSLSGVMQVLEESLNANLDAELIHLDSEYYILLNEFDSTDEDLQLIMPFTNLYLGRWLHIDNDSIPESIRTLETGDSASDEALRGQLKELFVSSNIFVIDQDNGTKKIDDHKAFHLDLTIDPDGFRDYLTQASALNGQSFSIAELEEVIEALDYFESIEVYIDTETFDVYKIIIKLSTAAKMQAQDGASEETAEATPEADETERPMELEVVIEGSNYNQEVELRAPDNYEDFNPLNLLMGLGNVTLPPIDDTIDADTENQPNSSDSTEAESDSQDEDGEE